MGEQFAFPSALKDVIYYGVDETSASHHFLLTIDCRKAKRYNIRAFGVANSERIGIIEPTGRRQRALRARGYNPEGSIQPQTCFFLSRRSRTCRVWGYHFLLSHACRRPVSLFRATVALEMMKNAARGLEKCRETNSRCEVHSVLGKRCVGASAVANPPPLI